MIRPVNLRISSQAHLRLSLKESGKHEVHRSSANQSVPMRDPSTAGKTTCPRHSKLKIVLQGPTNTSKLGFKKMQSIKI